MRRWIAFAAALALLLCAGTAAGEQDTPAGTGTSGTGWDQFGIPFLSAAPTATPAPNAFRFRGGIRWNMSMQQVKALESEKMTERSMSSWSIMFTDEKVAVSMYTADLVFMFREDRLMMITYEFQRQNAQNDFLYLSLALSSLYGEKTLAEAVTVKALMDAVNPNHYPADQIREASCWTAADGTAVFQYYYAQDKFGIMYVSPDLGGRFYQTNGL